MNILVPIFVCVVLPIAIVLIVYLASMNSDNKRAKILIKAIESGNGIDADRLAEALRKPRKSARELLNLRLLRGCIFAFIGLGLVIMAVINTCCGVDFSEDSVTFPMIFGSISLAIGLSYLIVYYVNRKQVNEDK